MEKTKHVRGVAALAATLCVAVLWFAVSCGNSESGPPAVSWSTKPVIKAASAFVFGLPVIVETGDRGYTSLAIDPDDNNPAIAYHDYENNSLKYAKYNGSTWDIAVVDDVGNAIPDPVLGKYPSLAFDSSGNPSIGYYDETNEALKWAYDEDEDGVWSEDGWPKEVADGENKNYGAYCSHKISGSSAGFAFYEANDADLIYLQINLNTMQTSMVEPDTTNDVGQCCSLHFRSSQPTVSYYDATNGDLKYAKFNGSTWDVEVADDGDGDDVGKWTSLDYQPGGDASIAYYNVTDTNPMWVRWDEEEEEWGDPVTLVDAGDEVWGLGMSHQWYSSTVCGFAFEAVEVVEEEDESHLKFVRWVDGEQTPYDADNTKKCGDWCSMAWVQSGGSSGDVWISHRHFEDEDKDLRYAYGDLT